MITLYDLHKFVSTVQPVCSAVDFDAISIAIGPKNMNNGEFNCRGIYSWGKRIVVSNVIGFLLLAVGFVLHLVDHLLVDLVMLPFSFAFQDLCLHLLQFLFAFLPILHR